MLSSWPSFAIEFPFYRCCLCLPVRERLQPYALSNVLHGTGIRSRRRTEGPKSTANLALKLLTGKRSRRQRQHQSSGYRPNADPLRAMNCSHKIGAVSLPQHSYSNLREPRTTARDPRSGRARPVRSGQHSF